jgi:dTDP-4-dehydrorhamnose reductase
MNGHIVIIGTGYLSDLIAKHLTTSVQIGRNNNPNFSAFYSDFLNALSSYSCDQLLDLSCDLYSHIFCRSISTLTPRAIIISSAIVPRQFSSANHLFNINVKLPLAMLHLAIILRVQKYIFLSSCGVYGLHSCPDSPLKESAIPRPYNAYTHSKVSAESLLKRLVDLSLPISTSVSILRLATILSPSSFVVRLAILMKELHLLSLYPRFLRTFLSPECFLICLDKILLSPGFTFPLLFNICNSSSTSHVDIIHSFVDPRWRPSKISMFFPVRHLEYSNQLFHNCYPSIDSFA